MEPKGKLLIIGGAEYLGSEDVDANGVITKSERYIILRELLESAKNKKIEVITTGSKVQNEVKKRYQKAFRRLNYPNPGFIPIENKMEAKDKHYLTRVEEAGAVFFTGGDQFRLATILGATPIVDLIKEKYQYDKNFLVAGTSAGAMAMSAVMITAGGLCEAMFNSDIKTSSGLGLIHNCIIDTHFIKRGRFVRLAHAIVLNPDQLGIGLGEDTALIIKNGTNAECRGSGAVIIIDGKNIRQTNITNVEENEPIFVENLKVHILVRNCRFSIHSRKLAKPAISLKKRN